MKSTALVPLGKGRMYCWSCRREVDPRRPYVGIPIRAGVMRVWHPICAPKRTLGRAVRNACKKNPLYPTSVYANGYVSGREAKRLKQPMTMGLSTGVDPYSEGFRDGYHNIAPKAGALPEIKKLESKMGAKKNPWHSAGRYQSGRQARRMAKQFSVEKYPTRLKQVGKGTKVEYYTSEEAPEPYTPEWFEWTGRIKKGESAPLMEKFGPEAITPAPARWGVGTALARGRRERGLYRAMFPFESYPFAKGAGKRNPGILGEMASYAKKRLKEKMISSLERKAEAIGRRVEKAFYGTPQANPKRKKIMMPTVCGLCGYQRGSHNYLIVSGRVRKHRYKSAKFGSYKFVTGPYMVKEMGHFKRNPYLIRTERGGKLSSKLAKSPKTMHGMVTKSLPKAGSMVEVEKIRTDEYHRRRGFRGRPKWGPVANPRTYKQITDDIRNKLDIVNEAYSHGRVRDSEKIFHTVNGLIWSLTPNEQRELGHEINNQLNFWEKKLGRIMEQNPKSQHPDRYKLELHDEALMWAKRLGASDPDRMIGITPEEWWYFIAGCESHAIQIQKRQLSRKNPYLVRGVRKGKLLKPWRYMEKPFRSPKAARRALGRMSKIPGSRKIKITTKEYQRISGYGMKGRELKKWRPVGQIMLGRGTYKLPRGRKYKSNPKLIGMAKKKTDAERIAHEYMRKTGHPAGLVFSPRQRMRFGAMYRHEHRPAMWEIHSFERGERILGVPGGMRGRRRPLKVKGVGEWFWKTNPKYKKNPRAISLKQAKSLQYGQHIYHRTLRNADGSPMTFKIYGKPKTWKKQPNRVMISLKRGLYEHMRITESDLSQFSLTEGKRKSKKNPHTRTGLWYSRKSTGRRIKQTVKDTKLAKRHMRQIRKKRYHKNIAPLVVAGAMAAAPVVMKHGKRILKKLKKKNPEVDWRFRGVAERGVQLSPREEARRFAIKHTHKWRYLTGYHRECKICHKKESREHITGSFKSNPKRTYTRMQKGLRRQYLKPGERSLLKMLPRSNPLHKTKKMFCKKCKRMVKARRWGQPGFGVPTYRCPKCHSRTLDKYEHRRILDKQWDRMSKKRVAEKSLRARALIKAEHHDRGKYMKLARRHGIHSVPGKQFLKLAMDEGKHARKIRKLRKAKYIQNRKHKTRSTHGLTMGQKMVQHEVLGGEKYLALAHKYPKGKRTFRGIAKQEFGHAMKIANLKKRGIINPRRPSAARREELLTKIDKLIAGKKVRPPKEWWAGKGRKRGMRKIIGRSPKYHGRSPAAKAQITAGIWHKYPKDTQIKTIQKIILGAGGIPNPGKTERIPKPKSREQIIKMIGYQTPEKYWRSRGYKLLGASNDAWYVRKVSKKNPLIPPRPLPPKPEYPYCNQGHLLQEVYNERRNAYVWDCPTCIRMMQRNPRKTEAIIDDINTSLDLTERYLSSEMPEFAKEHFLRAAGAWDKALTSNEKDMEDHTWRRIQSLNRRIRTSTSAQSNPLGPTIHRIPKRIASHVKRVARTRKPIVKGKYYFTPARGGVQIFKGKKASFVET
jgi:hypothetical protein